MAGVVKSNSTSKAKIKAKDKTDIPKPQVNFKEKINNDPQPFLHKLKEKPYSLKPLSFQERDSHPYEFELENFTPDPIFLDVKNDIPLLPLSKTPLIMIDSTEGFEHLLQDLLLQTVIAVDLEHHDSRSYQGITCLMQISTGKSDYIVDTLKLWDQLQPLNQVFCNPKILKIFQAAENDVVWLQRDFGIYVVNLFDTCQAASLLGLKRKGLAFLLQHYCQIRISKSYQRADWRIRPLSKEMLNYARGDTHYLIYIYERLKQDLNSGQFYGKLDGSSIRKEGKEGLLKKCHELKRSKASKTTANDTGVKRMLEVWKNSRSICLRRYKIPPKEKYLKSYNKLIEKDKNFNRQQLYALQELCAWRDRVARDEDESPNFVVPNYMLVTMTHHLPNNPQHLLRCCSYAPFVQQHLLHIHGIMLKARELDISSTTTKETRTTSETKEQYKKGRKRKSTFSFAETSQRLTKKRAIGDVSSIAKKSVLVTKTHRVELTNLACEKKSPATTRKEKPSQSQNM